MNFSNELSTGYSIVKQAIEKQFNKHRKATLARANVEKIAFEAGLEQDDIKGVFSYFNTLGVALFYDDSDIVFNPYWISHGVYTIINYMQNKDLTEIHINDMKKIFKGKNAKQYNIEKCRIVFDFMNKHELAFPTQDNKDILFVPLIVFDKRHSELPEAKQSEEIFAKYIFPTALAEKILQRYVHRNSKYIKQENGNYIAWNRGMYLEMDGTNANAMVEVKESREIKITVWGEKKDEFFNYLHDIFLVLLEELQLFVFGSEQVENIPNQKSYSILIGVGNHG